MMTQRLFLSSCKKLTLLCLLLIAPITYGQEIAVIIGSKFNTTLVTLNASEVQSIFLRKRYFTAEGDSWIPVNLNAANPQRLAFTRDVLQKTVPDLEHYWSELYFNGISPPYVLASEAAVINFVIATPNAIAYVLACHVDLRVRVVYRFQIENNTPLSCATK